MRKATILIVEDDAGVLATLADRVRSFGYDVSEAPDAESALILLRGTDAIDLVITDMQLPGMSGVDLLEEVKRILPAMPVIMLTGHCSVESFIETQSRGVFEYVNKPVRAAELRRIIETAMSSASGTCGCMPTDD
jgi:DNA-binding NtrC family response regulator